MASSEEDACYLYSPCSLFQQFIKACFNCFGHDEEHDHEQHSTTPLLPHAISPSGTEMKSTVCIGSLIYIYIYLCLFFFVF